MRANSSSLRSGFNWYCTIFLLRPFWSSTATVRTILASLEPFIVTPPTALSALSFRATLSSTIRLSFRPKIRFLINGYLIKPGCVWLTRRSKLSLRLKYLFPPMKQCNIGWFFTLCWKMRTITCFVIDALAELVARWPNEADGRWFETWPQSVFRRVKSTLYPFVRSINLYPIGGVIIRCPAVICSLDACLKYIARDMYDIASILTGFTCKEAELLKVNISLRYK